MPASRSLACSPRSRSRCALSAGSSFGGIMVSRLLPPLPNCTESCSRSRSTSFTRSRKSSDSRNPAAYMSSAIRRLVPSIAANSRLHSSCVNTEGTFRPRRARVKSLKSPGSRFSTSRKKKTTAFKAWLCVETETRSFTAKPESHFRTSLWSRLFIGFPPIEAMKRRHHARYVFSLVHAKFLSRIRLTSAFSQSGPPRSRAPAVGTSLISYVR